MQMPAKTSVAAIIAAGGSGARFAGEAQTGETKKGKAKQFLFLKGIPLYAWCLSVLGKHESLSEIVIVTPADMVKATQEEIDSLGPRLQIKIPCEVIAGGKTRQESVFKGLKFLCKSGNTPEYVLVHDAARPLIDAATIDRVISKVIECGACTVGGAVSDTIKKVEDGKVVETLNREELVAVQTPQASKFTDLLQAHEKACLSGFATTDDAALLEWSGHEVQIVEGPKYNLKVTQPLDLMLAEVLADFLFKDHL